MQVAGPKDGGWKYTQSDPGAQNGNPGENFQLSWHNLESVSIRERTIMTISRRFTLQQILPVIGLGGLVIGLAKAEPQPHMRTALEHLRAARQSLEKAEPDKGGHRVKAIEMVNGAIREVEAGIAYANRH